MHFHGELIKASWMSVDKEHRGHPPLSGSGMIRNPCVCTSTGTPSVLYTV